MVMADRPDVPTASPAIAAIDLVGLGGQLVTALVRVPFRRPWSGPAGVGHNIGQSVTREVVRSFMGYSSGLPIDEFRSVEGALDSLCKVVLTPWVRAKGVETSDEVVGGVPGIWYRPDDAEPIATILYLHGGGYVGTSPTMYAAFTAALARTTQCEVFVADYRLAPEFPFPAGVIDALAVAEALRSERSDRRIFLAGDSGGGGLAGSAVYFAEKAGHPPVAGLILFSPEADLMLDQPSVTENAPHDILPWNIPTAPYLHGESATSSEVSEILADVSEWPPTLVAWGSDEMFRDAIRILVEHLEKAQVPTVAIEEPGMFHVFPILMPWAAASRRVGAAVGDFVRRTVTG
jgi:monoterpene epsilon-lactone hydrolase